MAETRIIEIIDQIKAFSQERNIKVDKIIVFGSWARGDYTAQSDIDIAIISSDFNGRDIFQKTEMLKGLQWILVEKFVLPFDIIPISLQDWQAAASPIIEYVKQGKVMYSAA